MKTEESQAIPDKIMVISNFFLFYYIFLEN